MLGMDKHREAGRNVFLSSINGLANVLAIAAAFLLTPKLYGFSVDWVCGFVAENYGASWTALASFGWAGISGATIFFLARATIGTAFVMGGLAVASRFL